MEPRIGEIRKPRTARQFFELIAPSDSDQDAKIKTYIDVRKLRIIVGNPFAEAALFDPDQSLASALQLAEPVSRADTLVDFMSQVRRFRESIKSLTVDGLRSLSEQDAADMEVLSQLIASRLEDQALVRQNV